MLYRYGIPVWTEGRRGRTYLDWIQVGSTGFSDERDVARAVRLQEAYAKNVEKLEHTEKVLNKVLGETLLANLKGNV